MTITVSNVATTDTFGAWLTKTNVLATLFTQNTVTSDSTITGSLTTGNAYVNGFFGANTLVAFTGIAGGSLNSGNTLNLLTNTAFVYSGANLVSVNANTSFSNLNISTNSVNISPVGGNTNISGNFLNINASTSNITSTSLNVVSTLTQTGNSVFRANTSFNILSLTGNSTVSVFLANTTNATFVGNTTFSNSIIVSNLANVNQLNVFGAVTSNISGNLRIDGNLSIGGNLAYSGTTGGDIIPGSNNLFRLGNTTNRWSDLFTNNVITLTTNTTTLNVSGLTNFSGNVTPSTNNSINIGNSSLYWNSLFVSNTNSNNLIVSNVLSLPAGSASLPSFSFSSNSDTGLYRPAASTIGFSAAGVLRLSVNSTTVTVNNSFGVENTSTFTGNATFSNTTSFVGNATFTSSINANLANFSSNVTFSGSLITNSAHIFSKTYSFNNSTATANIDVEAATTYRSFEYNVQLTDNTTVPPRYQTTKILIIHDGSTPYITEYGTLFNVSSLGSFDAIINGGNIALQLTPATANVVAKFLRTSIVQ
jgi:hypothetical protein